jgi:hypothetical protein
MFDWLFEGRMSVYVFLGGLAIILLVLWWQNRNGRFLVAVGFVVGLAGVYYLLDRLVETDREMAHRNIEEMAASVAKRDLDGLFNHISDNFISPRKQNKTLLRIQAEDYINNGLVTSITVWQINFPEGVSREKETCNGSFMFKVRGRIMGNSEDMPFRCDGVYRFHPQHGWQLESCRITDAISDNELTTQF